MFFESVLRSRTAQKQHRYIKRVILFFLRSGYLVHQVWWRLRHPTTVGCRVMIRSGSQVLLVKHTYNHRYFFPGGLVEYGEGLKEAGAREVLEETGLTIDSEKLKLIGVYRSVLEGKDNTLVVFWMHMNSPISVEIPSDRWYELAEVGWYDIDNLPKLASKSTRVALEDYKNGEFPVVRSGWEFQ